MSAYHYPKEPSYGYGYQPHDAENNFEQQFEHLSLENQAPYADDEDEVYEEHDQSAYYETPVGLGRRTSARRQTAPAALTYQEECVRRIEREIENAPQETERIKPDKDGAWIKVEGVGWHLLRWEYLYVWLMDPENTKSLPLEDIVRQTGEFLRARATPEGWANYELHKRKQEEAAARYAAAQGYSSSDVRGSSANYHQGSGPTRSRSDQQNYYH